METLNDLLAEEMQDIYSAEKQIIKALPKMVKGARSGDLKDALSAHLEETKEQVSRLEQAFESMGESGRAKHCKGMQGLLEEGAECLEQNEEGTLRDLQIIGAAQRVEHYEIAAYGTARAIAEQLGLDQVIELLDTTLGEEEAADEKLSGIAGDLYAEVEAPATSVNRPDDAGRESAKSRARSESAPKKSGTAKTGTR